MIGYFATPPEIQVAEQQLSESWQYSTYPMISYLQDTKNPDPAYGEEANKIYNLVASFPGEVRDEPTVNEMIEIGENWQEGTIFVSVPRIILAQTYINPNSPNYVTLESVLKIDDRLEIPTLFDADGSIKQWKIQKIKPQGWMGNVALMRTLQCIAKVKGSR